MASLPNSNAHAVEEVDTAPLEVCIAREYHNFNLN